jgi:hypothetical protein
VGVDPASGGVLRKIFQPSLDRFARIDHPDHPDTSSGLQCAILLDGGKTLIVKTMPGPHFHSYAR